jgi:hypothetical protein
MFWFAADGGNAHKSQDLRGRLAAIHKFPAVIEMPCSTDDADWKEC